MQTEPFKDQVEANLSETLQPNLSPKAIDRFILSLPPIEEQREIVRRVEGLFALANQLEVRYAKAKAHINKVAQSILAKAFRGELMPQNPKDEPAEVLLKRIREGQLADAPAEEKRSKAEADRPALLKNRKTRKRAAAKRQARRDGLRRVSKK